jgi:hypothetical protein
MKPAILVGAAREETAVKGGEAAKFCAWWKAENKYLNDSRGCRVEEKERRQVNRVPVINFRDERRLYA